MGDNSGRRYRIPINRPGFVPTAGTSHIDSIGSLSLTDSNRLTQLKAVASRRVASCRTQRET
eukprot:scaffold15662_cov60-Attheya_sp.AAC.3